MSSVHHRTLLRQTTHAPNAFMIFSKPPRKELTKLHPELHQSEISRLLGKAWADLPLSQRQFYFRLSDQYRKDIEPAKTAKRRENDRKRRSLYFPQDRLALNREGPQNKLDGGYTEGSKNCRVYGATRLQSLQRVGAGPTTCNDDVAIQILLSTSYEATSPCSDQTFVSTDADPNGVPEDALMALECKQLDVSTNTEQDDDHKTLYQLLQRSTFGRPTTAVDYRLMREPAFSICVPNPAPVALAAHREELHPYQATGPELLWSWNAPVRTPSSSELHHYDNKEFHHRHNGSRVQHPCACSKGSPHCVRPLSSASTLLSQEPTQLSSAAQKPFFCSLSGNTPHVEAIAGQVPFAGAQLNNVFKSRHVSHASQSNADVWAQLHSVCRDRGLSVFGHPLPTSAPDISSKNQWGQEGSLGARYDWKEYFVMSRCDRGPDGLFRLKPITQMQPVTNRTL